LPTRSAILALVLGLCALPSRPGRRDYYFAHDDVMGTSHGASASGLVDTPGPRGVAEARALRESRPALGDLQHHDPSSEFRRWQATAAGPSRVSPELLEVLEEADAWRERSGGAFDPRVEALSILWSEAARRAVPRPSPSSSRHGPRWPAGLAARRQGRDRRAAPGAPADPGRDPPRGTYRRTGLLRRHGGRPGGRGLVLNIGGDLRTQGDPPRTVAVAGPALGSESTAPIGPGRGERPSAVATSGRKHRGYRIGTRWYSHIIDPRTGEPAEAVASSTVIAERSSDADALATILNVLPPEEGLRWSTPCRGRPA